ncbi:MAG: apolipoprotein N-acyltransferase [Ignavibacteria bacterium]|nr:apolipoprotein N-acyltransferase [Ignavibacteria bacterium]
MLKIETKSDLFKNIFLSLLSGVLLSLSFPPFETGFFAYFGLVPLLIFLNRAKNYRELLIFTYLSMLVFHALTLYWIGGWTSKTDPFMMIGSVALILVHPFFYWIPFVFFRLIKIHLGNKSALFAFPFLWNSLEYLRSVDDTAFPWLTLGNTQSYYLPLIQITSIIGVYGLSFLIVVFNVLLYAAYKNFRYESFRFTLNKLSIIVIILVSLFIYGKVILNDAIYDGKKITVGIVQPDFDPWEKWEDEVNPQIDVYLQLSDSAVKNGAELIVWPESALPVYLLSGNYPEEVKRIKDFCRTNNVAIATGLPLVHFYFSDEMKKEHSKISRDSSYYYDTYNGVVLFLPDSDLIQEYGKMNLVPFAERAPYLDYLPFLGDLIKWSVGISNWSVWDKQTIFNFKTRDGDSAKFAASVCYESIFPSFNSEFVKKGAQFLVVVTNDSWYGKSSGPYQHKQFAVFRAIENRRWIVRSANGGISCIIDPFGRTIFETKLFERTYFTGEIYLNNEITYYVQYRDLISYLSLIFSGFFILLSFIKKLGVKKRDESN